MVPFFVATRTEHSVCLWHSIVTYFSGTNAVAALWIEKLLSAFWAAESIVFFAYPSNHSWFLPTEFLTTLCANVFHVAISLISGLLRHAPAFLSLLGSHDCLPSTQYMGAYSRQVLRSEAAWCSLRGRWKSLQQCKTTQGLWLLILEFSTPPSLLAQVLTI